MVRLPAPPRLSLVVPAYNEERRLPATLETINAYLGGLGGDSELFVVDDGSTDGTAAAVAETARRWPRTRLLQYSHRGKGHAVKQGMLAATGDYLLLSDADLSVPLEELARFLPPATEADVVIGSRELPGAQRLGEPAFRHLMGRVFNRLVRWITGLPYRDTQCGFKLFRRSTAQSLFALQRVDGFGFDVEILYLARQRGLAVVWRYGTESRVRPLRHSLTMLGEALAVRWNVWRGTYTAPPDEPR
jgi:glycosyltransferase involved in cell wall biosynthesis